MGIIDQMGAAALLRTHHFAFELFIFTVLLSFIT